MPRKIRLLMLDLQSGLEKALEAEDSDDVSVIRPNWLSAVEIYLSKAEVEAGMDRAIGMQGDNLPDGVHYQVNEAIRIYAHTKQAAETHTVVRKGETNERRAMYDALISVREPQVIEWSGRPSLIARNSSLCRTCGRLFKKVSKHEGGGYCNSLVIRSSESVGSYRWELYNTSEVSAERARILESAGYKVEKVPSAYKYRIDRKVYYSLVDIHKNMEGISFSKFIKLSGTK